MKLSELSPRQRQVVQCLAKGLSPKGIAAEMKIDQRCVYEHLRLIGSEVGATGHMEILLHFFKLEPRQ